MNSFLPSDWIKKERKKEMRDVTCPFDWTNADMDDAHRLVVHLTVLCSASIGINCGSVSYFVGSLDKTFSSRSTCTPNCRWWTIIVHLRLPFAPIRSRGKDTERPSLFSFDYRSLVRRRVWKVNLFLVCPTKTRINGRRPTVKIGRRKIQRS